MHNVHALPQLNPDPVVPLGDDYQPLQLVTPQLLDRFWPQASQLFERCVSKALNGEYTTDNILEMARVGKAMIIVVTNDTTGEHPDTDVSLALAIEPVLYPQLNAINILALGGRNLVASKNKHWDSFIGWAYMNGARMIEANVSPSMMRMIKRWGFEPVYTQARFSLEKPNVYPVQR